MIEPQTINKFSYFSVLLLGFILSIIGFISFLNVIVAWHFSGVFLWLSLLYAVMDGILAYGMFHFKRWALFFLGINLVANIILVFIGYFAHGSFKNLSSVAMALIIGLFAGIHYRYFKGKWFEGSLCTILFLCWLLSIIYNGMILVIGKVF